jgi:hypothetical protein
MKTKTTGMKKQTGYTCTKLLQTKGGKTMHKFYLRLMIMAGILIAPSYLMAADYSTYTTEQLSEMRGTMQNATAEERNAFRNEWQSRMQAATPEERAAMRNSNGQGKRYGSGNGTCDGSGKGHRRGSSMGGYGNSGSMSSSGSAYMGGGHGGHGGGGHGHGGRR